MATSHVTVDRDYPQMIAETDHVEPAPRRVRATLGGELIFDSTQARYVWEWAYYPQYYLPVEDVDERFLVDEHHEQRLRQGTARRHGFWGGGGGRPAVTACGLAAWIARTQCVSSVTKRSTGWLARLVSTGTHWMPGMRRTSRSSS